MRARDPIDELLEALVRDGKPALAWTVRWSQGGHEPVNAAWAASRSADAMVALLGRLDPAVLERVTEHLERQLGPGWYHWQASEIAPVIRAAVPVLPDLAFWLSTRP